MNTLFTTLLLIGNIWIGSPDMKVYGALKGKSLESIETVLIDLDLKRAISTNNAYRGTLLMKKSGFMETLGKKVALFKEGHQLLENEIQKDPGNSEYRFLRLAIQEHAPKILGYNKDIEKDKRVIIANFKSFDPSLQKYILEYANNSDNLEVTELIL